MSKDEQQKLIIIGFDGATFDVLDSFMDMGRMPNLRWIIDNGTKGEMESSIPPVTGPSWTSFMTGMGPGKHGLYDFVKPRPGSVKREPATYLDIQAPTLWHYLNESGKKAGVVNLPITYPAPVIDGFVIPGLGTPCPEGEFGYPKGIMKELETAVGPYIFDVWWQNNGKNGVEKFLKNLAECARQRIKSFHYLMDNKEWDVFMGVFIGTDRIQHYIWQYILPKKEAKLTNREKKLVAMTADYYTILDSFLGEIKEKYRNKADLMIVSDHGFGPLEQKMFINTWLEEKGYLSINWNRVRKTKFMRTVRRSLKNSIDFCDPLKLRKMILPKNKRTARMSAYDFLDDIDWSKTMAYSASSTEQGVYLNLKGREPLGILDGVDEYNRVRDKLIEELKVITHPLTGEKMVSEIYKREELYQGPYVGNAPDIVLFLNGGRCLLDVQLEKTVFGKAGWHTGFGTHRKNGIFIGHGPNFKSGTVLVGTHIVDMTPTILFQQGLKVPEVMDGRPVLDLFSEEFLNKNKVSLNTDLSLLQKDRNDMIELSDSEQAAIESKLEKLGYL